MAALPEPLQPTVAAVYRAYEDKQDDGYRFHLGASLIGDPCDRSLFYSFRWATVRAFEGRLLRLFDTGNKEEARFVADLRSAGVEVYDFDFENPDKQISVRDEFGHFGGSLDGVGLGLLEAPMTWHVLEFKTHGEKSFKELVAKKVQKSKPRHYAQMQVYMHFMGMTRAYYLAKNKNTDELYSERVHYDIEFATRMVAKANRVIKTSELPAKLSNDPGWFECKFCDHHEVCHGEAKPARHCRSCLHSTPIEGGEWDCAKFGQIPRDVQQKGCVWHLYNPGFIHGEQIDVIGDGEGIVYKMKDGTEWVDGIPF